MRQFRHHPIEAKSSFSLSKLSLNTITNSLGLQCLFIFFFTNIFWRSSQGRTTDYNTSFLTPSSVISGSINFINKTDFIPPIQTNEFLPPISRWTTFGGMIILGILSLAIPVAAIAKYKVTVKGQAVVRPIGELRVVEATTEGQVMQIYVKQNQVVKKGDAVATIDDSRLQTNIQQAKLQLVQTQAQIQAFNSF